jgi:hypothetical protein
LSWEPKAKCPSTSRRPWPRATHKLIDACTS